jgi:1-acyl-sn-glycerol-3-phosphate acyltransferase
MKSLKRPNPHFFRKVAPLLEVMERYFGYEVVGLENIPARGPALVVMNHGVIPFHAYLLIKQIFFKLGRIPRMLAAKFLFQIPVLRNLFMQGGALDANHRNAKAVLKRGELAMVAPGGIYEALLVHPKMKTIPWHGRYGFVVLACKMEVPIIPSYCQGINEVYLTSRALLKQRVRILRKYWFSLPLFFGIGLLPLPVKLTHRVGEPISTLRRKGETFRKTVRRVHEETLMAMKELMKQRYPAYHGLAPKKLSQQSKKRSARRGPVPVAKRSRRKIG